jgi:cytidylate kinase
MTSPAVVAIDGAAGSGKSTLARALARRLHLPYVNTGLMYRALAAAAVDRGVVEGDGPTLAAIAEGLRFEVVDGQLHVEGYSDADLSSGKVEASVSRVAGHAPVRAVMRSRQRLLGVDGAVMEGRDIGSIVFPDAPVKLFLVADPSERARRRSSERSNGVREEVETALHDRDRRDARTVAHVPTTDADVIDTGALDANQTLAAALEVIRRLAPGLLR